MFNDIIKAIGIEPYYRDNNVAIFNGDCKEILPLLSNIDAIVTDPPYGLVSINKRFGNGNAHNTPAMETKEGSVWARKAKGFMGKEWDGSGIEYDVEMWQGCINALKNGGHLLAFGGTRTYHRMACAIEDAGFEIRDMIEWVYGSGFPKSHNVSKAIDKKLRAEREIIDSYTRKGRSGGIMGEKVEIERNITAPATPEAQQWEGWGTALKPAHEPVCLARKPLIGTVVQNVLEYGVGGLNIDGCRVEYSETNKPIPQLAQNKREIKTNNGMYGGNSFNESKTKSTIGGNLSGRFPANLIHDGQVDEIFPETKSGEMHSIAKAKQYNTYGKMYEREVHSQASSGSAARFFYCAKASKSEKDAGCEELVTKQTIGGGGMNNTEDDVCGKYGSIKAPGKNHHPTVKPLALMEYLIKLITPPKGIVLDPFMGSGSTLVAARKLGYKAIGIELSKDYAEIAVKRLAQGVLL